MKHDKNICFVGACGVEKTNLVNISIQSRDIKSFTKGNEWI